ncbi:MAG: hypothetical protein IJT26_04265 [Bacteroidales bacterium]|nr:hypothetical protein [Bacteroidales bacterium]
MKRENEALPLSELEVTVEGLLPKQSGAARGAYFILMILLIILFVAVIA